MRELQIDAREFTNRGSFRDFKSGQRDYKSGQGLQIGAEQLRLEGMDTPLKIMTST